MIVVTLCHGGLGRVVVHIGEIIEDIAAPGVVRYEIPVQVDRVVVVVMQICPKAVGVYPDVPWSGRGIDIAAYSYGGPLVVVNTVVHGDGDGAVEDMDVLYGVANIVSRRVSIVSGRVCKAGLAFGAAPAGLGVRTYHPHVKLGNVHRVVVIQYMGG